MYRDMSVLENSVYFFPAGTFRRVWIDVMIFGTQGILHGPSSAKSTSCFESRRVRLFILSTSTGPFRRVFDRAHTAGLTSLDSDSDLALSRRVF